MLFLDRRGPHIECECALFSADGSIICRFFGRFLRLRVCFPGSWVWRYSCGGVRGLEVVGLLPSWRGFEAVTSFCFALHNTKVFGETTVLRTSPFTNKTGVIHTALDCRVWAFLTLKFIRVIVGSQKGSSTVSDDNLCKKTKKDCIGALNPSLLLYIGECSRHSKHLLVFISVSS